MFAQFKGFGDETGYEAQSISFSAAPNGRRGNCLPRSISFTLVLRINQGEAEVGSKLLDFAAQQHARWNDQGKGELKMYIERRGNEGLGLIRTIKFEGATLENISMSPGDANFGGEGAEAVMNVGLTIWAAKVSIGDVEFVVP